MEFILSIILINYIGGVWFNFSVFLISGMKCYIDDRENFKIDIFPIIVEIFMSWGLWVKGIYKGV